ncbi:MAG: DNA adenine methylase, partial [Nitrospinae bacterium]|nr:DNA adenine methylase [Nitrospinota bacterium]
MPCSKTKKGKSKPSPKVRRRYKAPFGYYGSKLRLVSRIVDGLPPHNAWVEVFCGSAAVTLAKDPAPIEIINDLDGDIVNLFQQLRDNTDSLCKSIALTPYARSEFQKAKKGTRSSDPLERARCFLVATMMTVNGTYNGSGGGFSVSQSYSRNGREARVRRWYNVP